MSDFIFLLDFCGGLTLCLLDSALYRLKHSYCMCVLWSGICSLYMPLYIFDFLTAFYIYRYGLPSQLTFTQQSCEFLK